MTIQEWSGINSPFKTDSECILLLPVLVERGYRPELYYEKTLWKFAIYIKDNFCIGAGIEPTIAAAITSALLILIEKETRCR